MQNFIQKIIICNAFLDNIIPQKTNILQLLHIAFILSRTTSKTIYVYIKSNNHEWLIMNEKSIINEIKNEQA